MLNKKELVVVSVAIVLMSLILSFINFNFDISRFPVYLLFSVIIIGTSCIVKKIVAKIKDISIEFEFWGFQRYGIAQGSYFKKPFPAGIFAPLLLGFLGFRYFFIFLQFEAKETVAAVVKRFGKNRYSGVMEWDDALFAFYSTLVLMILAVAAHSINLNGFLEFSRITTYYLLWNLIPFGKIDGAKIFYGSRPLFYSTVILALLSLAIVLV